MDMRIDFPGALPPGKKIQAYSMPAYPNS